ncbi:SprT-like family protein [Corynebacterium guangdongense]|nr:SprT-like family protein [Corynebacterium guangdongense]
MTAMTDPSVPGETEKIEIIRSARRKRTTQARLEGDRIVVRVPAGLSPKEESEAVASVVTRLRRKTRPASVSDADLQERAHRLNREVLEGRATPGSIRWVSNQNKRWGSCTISTGDIRISDRLQHVPGYVLDSVIVHELVHTFVPDHSPRFHAWADRAPQVERAAGYLEAYQRWGGFGNDATPAGEPGSVD